MPHAERCPVCGGSEADCHTCKWVLLGREGEKPSKYLRCRLEEYPIGGGPDFSAVIVCAQADCPILPHGEVLMAQYTSRVTAGMNPDGYLDEVRGR
jgi:hypothetical protein